MKKFFKYNMGAAVGALVLIVILSVFCGVNRTVASRKSAVSSRFEKTVAADFDYKNRSFALKRASRAASRISTDALRKSIDILTEADLSLKSVRVNPRLHMEQLIARLLITAQEGRR